MPSSSTKTNPIVVNKPYKEFNPPMKPFSTDYGDFQLVTGIRYGGRSLVFFVQNTNSIFPAKYQVHEVKLSLTENEGVTDYDFVTAPYPKTYSGELGGIPCGDSGIELQRISATVFQETFYLFLLGPDWKTIYLVTMNLDFGVEGYYSLELPHAIYDMNAVVSSGNVQLFYLNEDNTKVGYSIFDKVIAGSNQITISESETIDVDFSQLPSNMPQPQTPFNRLTASTINQEGHIICLTDHVGNVYSAHIIENIWYPNQVAHVASPTQGQANTIMYAGDGPLLKQSGGDMKDNQSVVFLEAVRGLKNPVNCIQASSDYDEDAFSQVLGDTTTDDLYDMFVFEHLHDIGNQSYFRCLIVGQYSSIGNNNLSLQLFAVPTGTLVFEDETTTDTSQIDDMGLTPEQKKAYYQSWTLLGIIEGLPPFPYNGKEISIGAPSVSFDYTTDSGSELKQTSTTSYSAGASGKGDMFSLGGNISEDLKSSAGTSFSYEVSNTVTLGPFSSPPEERKDGIIFPGLLLFNQPTIQNRKYHLYAPDGSDTTLHIYITSYINMRTYFQSYDTLHPGGHEVSAGLNALPRGDDFEAWRVENFPLPNLPVFGEGSNDSVAITTLEANQSAHGSCTISANQSAKEGNATTTSVKFDGGLNIGVFGFSVSGGGSWDNSSDVYNSFKNGFTASMPRIQVNTPMKSTDYTSITVQPYIYQATAHDTLVKQGVVPDCFKGSAPWILTWRVVNYMQGEE